jgi:hypothetical protein
LNNNNGYDKVKVANGFQQRRYISFFLIRNKNRLKLYFPPAIAQSLEHFTKLPKHTYTRPEEADVSSL